MKKLLRWRRAILVVGAIATTASLGAHPVGAADTSAPQPNKDHWHVAFGLWNCGSWNAPLTSAEDPTGIHTHGDGLVHIHPFGPEAAGRNAVLQRFFEVTQTKVTDKSVTANSKALTIPATCKGDKTVIRTLVWPNVKSKSPKTFNRDPGAIALKDGQVIAVVVGGAKTNPGMPPSIAELVDPADLPPPDLSPAELKALPKAPPVPAFDLSGAPPTKLEFKDLVVGSGDPLATNQRGHMRYALYLWRTKALLTKSWEASGQPFAFARLGKQRNLPGIDKGLVGMKVGGIRRLVLPPSEAFGSGGNEPIKGDDTVVFYIQLLSIKK